ncbi:uncharacterized protein LOC112128467 [Cimex lectularius]|uniref:Uncharacterized protein n=1 Tax=Cimex lectularius TaxID=79782 RepID=A0A8I6TN37_CIMLE|nr:uncharacterized protein LOC112128467 [Cimex lectularius]
MERASSPYSHNSIPESLEEKYHTNYIYDQAPRVECDDQFHRPFTYFDHVNRTPYEDLEAKSSGSSITFLSNSIPSQEFFFPYQCDKTGQPKRMDVSKGFYRREHKTDKRILWEKYRRQRLWKKLNDRVRYNRALLPEIIGKIKSSESLTYTEADLNRIRIPRYEGPERQLHLQSLPDIYKHVRGIKPSKKFKRQPLKTGLWPSVRHFEDSEGSIWSFQAEDDVKSHPIKNATSKEIPMKRDTKLSIGQPRSSIYLSVDGFNESKDGKDGKLESIASSKPESTTKPEEVPTEQKWDVCSNRETPSNSSSDSDLDISSMTGEPSTVDDSSVTSESIELPLLVTNRHIYSSSSIEQLNKHKNTETSKEHLEMCLKEYLVNFTEKEVEEVYRKIMSDAHSSKSVHLQEENLPSGAERKEPVCPKLAQSVADDKGYKKKVSCTHFSQLPDESTVESISSQEERTVQFPHPLTINDLNNMILVDTEKIPDFESHLPPDKINLPSLKRKLFSHKRKHAFSLKNSKNMKYSLKITHKLVPEPFSGRVFSHKKPLFTLDLEDVIVQSAYRPINQYAGEIVTRLQLPIEQMRLLDDQSSVTSISEDEQGEENYVLKLRKEVQRREMQRAEMRLSPQYTTKYLGPKMGTTLLKRQQLNRITKEYTHQVLDRSDRKVYSRDLTVAMRDGRLKFKMGIAGTSEYLDEADDTIEFFTMPPIFHTTFELDANAQWIEPNAERRSSEESADINLFRSVLTEQYEAEAKSAEEAKQDSKGVNFKSTKRKSISKSPSSYPNENDSLHGQMSVTKNVSDDFIQNVGISKGLKQRAPMPMHCWIKAKKDIRKLLKFKIERPQQTEDDEESYVFKKKRFSHKTSVMNLRQFIREQEFNYPLDIALETEKLYENMKIDSFYDSDNNLQFYYPYDSHLSYKPGVVNIDYMALLFEERQRSIASSSEAEEDEGPSDNDSQWNVRKVYHQEAPILSDRDSESFDEDVILICDCPDATKIGVESVGSDSDKSVSLMFKMFMRDNPGQGFEDAYTTCRANIFKTIEGTTKGGDTEQIVFMADKKDSDEKLYTGDKDNDNDSDESNVSVELKKNMRLKYIEKLRGASVGEIAKKQVAADEKSKMGVMKQITKSAIKKIGIADDSGTIVSSTDSTIGMSQAHLSGNYSISIDPLDNAATQEVEVEKPFIHEEFVKAKSSSSSMSTGEYRIENGLPVKQVIKKRLNRGYNTLLRVLVKTEMTHLNRMRFKSTFNKPYKCLNIWSRTNRAIKTFQKKSEKPLDKNAVLPLSEFPPLVSNSQIAETEIAKKFNENIGSFEVQVNNIINKNTFGNIQSLPESALVPKVPTKEPKIVNLRWHYFPAMQAKRFEGYEKGPIADKLRESFDQDLLYSLVKVLEVPGQETNDQPRPAGREDRLSVVSSSEIIVQEVVAKPGRKKTEIQHGGGISLVDDPKIVETYLKEMQRMDKLDKRSKTGEVKAKGKRPFTHIKNFARHSLFMQATEHADNEKLFKWNDCIKCWIAKFSDIRNLIVPYLRMERRNINQMVIKCSHENDNSQFNSTIDMEAKKKSAQYNMDWIFSKKMRFPTLSSLYKIQDKQLFCVKNPYHEPYLYKIKEMHLGMKIGRYLKKEHGIQAQDIIPPEMILSYKHEKSIFMYPGIHFLPLEIFDNQSYDIR